MSNITDEEVEDMLPPIQDAGKEYPLQRDEVQTTLSKINHNIIGKVIVCLYKKESACSCRRCD